MSIDFSDEFERKCHMTKLSLDMETRLRPEETDLSKAHIRFIDHVHDLAVNMKDPTAKEKLKKDVIGYTDVICQCGWDIRKAHEILSTKYISKQEDKK